MLSLPFPPIVNFASSPPPVRRRGPHLRSNALLSLTPLNSFGVPLLDRPLHAVASGAPYPIFFGSSTPQRPREMADNCSSLAEPWIYRSPFSEDGGFWSSDPFSFETQALTRALKVSLSQGSSPDSSTPVPSPASATSSPASAFFSASSPLIKNEPAVSASDSDSAPARRAAPFVSPAATGRISKRKSRASKRSPTTFIAADPANFRQMVQQVTGVRIGDGAQQQLEGMLMRPEPQRATTGSRAAVPQSCLPTLDTSAFLLDRAAQPNTAVSVARGDGSFAEVEDIAGGSGGGGFSGFEIPCFPTLESWGVM